VHDSINSNPKSKNSNPRGECDKRRDGELFQDSESERIHRTRYDSRAQAKLEIVEGTSNRGRVNPLGFEIYDFGFELMESCTFEISDFPIS